MKIIVSVVCYKQTFQVLIRKTIFTPNIIQTSQKIRSSSFSLEQGSKYKNLAQRSFLFKGQSITPHCHIVIKILIKYFPHFQRRGPQRSVDVIVSAAFILTLLFLGFLSAEWLNDSVQLHSQYNLEALIWSCALGCFLLRFMTLGTKINRKYRSISVLITEQINLYLQVSTNSLYFPQVLKNHSSPL